MERFLAEGVAYAESVYAGSVVDFEEIRDGMYTWFSFSAFS
jgi:hypothetical protein